MTTPIIRCLKKSTKAQISYLTNSENFPILSNNPHIDKVYSTETISNDDINGMSIIIDLHNHKKSRSIYKHTKVKYLRTDKMPIRKWLMLWFRINLLNKSHVIDRHFDVISELQATDDGEGMQLFTSRSLNPLLENIDVDVVINVGGSKLTKRIPKSLVQKITGQTNRKITLIGGSDIQQEYNDIDNANVLNLTGQLSLQDSFWIIDQCSMLITSDSAMMHAGAALQKNQLVIWGSTSEDFGFFPYYGYKLINKSKSIQKELTCRPCSKYGKDHCPKGHMNCLMDISAKEVLLTMNTYN